MTWNAELFLNRASEEEIANHLSQCDGGFASPLSTRVEIGEYARKIFASATRFEAWSGDSLVGLVAVYCNDSSTRSAYITSVSVLSAFQGHGIASELMDRCIEYLRQHGSQYVQLEVDARATKAIRVYERSGFFTKEKRPENIIMRMDLGRKLQMRDPRDYNAEMRDTACHQYAYDFDFDVMHQFMLRSFEPFFNKGSLLELGCFKGDFTKRLLAHFEDVTCVEASAVAIEEARQKLGNRVNIVHATFETAALARRYDNIVVTHVLEHLDHPIHVLKRINDEWLAKNGRLFLACPNANAPSRQIAVKMGLISHNAAVTPAEAEHGHRRTYSLDTLERDASAAGLSVIHRSGIFFKALANFQWDRLLRTDIISKEYLEGCYKLGQHYPDLCSSIFLVCEKGDGGEHR